MSYTYILKLTILTSIFIFMVLFLIPANSVFAQQDATGADNIFDLIGIEKPTTWNSWSGVERQSYLQSLGAYPSQGRKYQGEVDIDRYFDTINVSKPKNWSNFTTKQRIDFINQITDQDQTKPTKSESETNSTHIDQNLSTNQLITPQQQLTLDSKQEKSIWSTPWLLIFFIVICLGLIIFATKNIIHKSW